MSPVLTDPLVTHSSENDRGFPVLGRGGLIRISANLLSSKGLRIQRFGTVETTTFGSRRR